MNNDEYIIQLNENGSYDLILGGVGLSGKEVEDLINELKADNVIPTDAKVNTYVYGSETAPEVNHKAKSFKDHRLQKNYEMAHNLDAKPSQKPSEN